MALKRKASVAKLEDLESHISGARNLKRLRIWIPSNTDLANCEATNNSEDTPSLDSSRSLFSATSDSLDSLFDEAEVPTIVVTEPASESPIPPAQLTAPSIKGLYFDPSVLLAEPLATDVVDFCRKTYFSNSSVNQVMLFGRFRSFEPADGSRGSLAETPSGLPSILLSLLDTLKETLRPRLPEATFHLLFPEIPTQARQAIINLYYPGEGITPHVDLLGRYADGIIGVSFGSGCAMRFDQAHPDSPCSTDTAAPAEAGGIAGANDHDDINDGTKEKASPSRYDLYLPERSILVMSKDARYKWTHGIEKRTRDRVLTRNDDDTIPDSSADNCKPAEQWLERGTRLSITFRWMLDGADVVGDS
ncbi:hypothetical protein FA15DRAFT_611119 [Coprinopsis marcescibilis]|uniref:Fe2OG dioxygenase domain-containing protein n=1 Tax=Coprinopsis marcescibilis TaxID=230819 RepID=A0A5C3L8F2_COPMA|nr:hypothetical protein FA15DRAFT_611119 [Coprinopsis marcescibilis]